MGIAWRWFFGASITESLLSVLGRIFSVSIEVKLGMPMEFP